MNLFRSDGKRYATLEKDIVDGKLGEVGAYDLEFKEGKLKFALKAGVGPLSADLVVALGADELLDALKKAIPGQVDDAVLELIKGALKS